MEKSLKIKWLVALALPIILYIGLIGFQVEQTLALYFTVTFTGILLFLLELMPNAVSALLLMFAYVAFNLAPLDVVFSGWLAESIWVTVGCLFMCHITQKTSLMERLVCMIVTCTSGSYLSILISMVILNLITILFIPGSMMTLVIVVISYSVCEELELGRSKAAAGIMLGSLATGYHSLISFLYVPGYFTMLTDSAKSVMDVDVNYFIQFKHNWVFIFVIIAEVLIINRVFAPKDFVGVKEKFIKKAAALPPTTSVEKRMVVLYIGLAIFLMTSSIHQIPMWFGFIMVTVLFFTPIIGIGKQEDVSQVNYGLLIFMVACLGIGNVANHLGIGQMIASYVSSFNIEGSTVLMTYLSFFIAFIMNLFMTPFAALSSFGGPLAQISLELDASVLPMFYAFYIGCNTIVFPYETASFATLYSMGNIELKHFIQYSLIRTAIWIVGIGIVAMTYWKFIGL